MKFSFQRVNGSGARLGVLSEIGRHGDKVWKTPMCFVYTRRGCIPHLTYETLQMLTKDTLPLLLPLVHLVETHESVRKFSKGIGAFIGLQEHLLYTSMQDPSILVPPGYNDKAGVSLWPNTGRVQCGVEKFMSIQEAFCPDFYQALCDSDTSITSSKGRLRKSVDRTIEYLDECIKIHNKCEKLRQTAIFGTIEGGFDLDYRRKSAKLTSERPVAGFIIDGFSNYGPETENFEFEEIKHILSETLQNIPSDKPRLMHLVWRPDNVIRALELGIDLFDASYPSILSGRGSALVLPLNYKKVRAKLPVEPVNDDVTESRTVELDLKDEKFKADFSPVLQGCDCYTCRQFTKAYINHLLNTSEMLAQVLLTLHNIHHYMKFFDVLKSALADDEFHLLKTHFLSFSYS